MTARRTSALAEQVRRIEDAALSVDGVVSLHRGAIGGAATYLPGQRVSGIRLADDATEVHIVVELSPDLREVAQACRDAVSAATGTQVTVVVADVAIPGDRPVILSAEGERQ